MSKKIFLSFKVLKTLIFACADIVLITGIYILAYLIDGKSFGWESLIFALACATLHIIVLTIFKGYSTVINHFGMVDAIRFAFLISLTCLISYISNVLIQVEEIKFTNAFLVYIFIFSSEALSIVGIRTIKRIVQFYSTGFHNRIKTIIIGAGAAGKIAFDEMHQNEKFNNRIMCFADSDPEKINKIYLTRPVIGMDKIKEYIEKNEVKEVVIAISSLNREELNEIIAKINNNNVTIKRLPLLTELKDPKEKMTIKNLSLAELLGREQITFDTAQIENWIKDKTVLITGGGGSIGSELARQCYDFKAKRLILFDIYENAVYDIQQELVRRMRSDDSKMELITLIGSTYNEFRVEEIFSKYHPDIVLHAAAYKHVPLMEDSPVEAIRTNCLGTYNVAKMADKYNTEKMVLVSTDKAVRPTNTMGATKSFAEMIIRYWSSISKNTKYSAVRFGNVLGSNGSVIPLFKRQIEEGGPVTVTHPEIIRYFMTIPEAVSLILQSGAFADGGEIFILDMGKPVKIVTLAENVIRQCGLIPYKDIKIKFTGLRPGEKLYEELLLDVTPNKKTSNSKIFVEETKHIFPMDEKIEFISKVFNMTDNDEIKNCLREVVTNYTYYEDFNAKVSKEKLEQAK